MATINNYFEDYFEPVTSVFTPDMAHKIVGLQPNAEVVSKITELGKKADAGTLSDEEFEEYKDFVDVGDFISVLKAKARRYLTLRAS